MSKIFAKRFDDWHPPPLIEIVDWCEQQYKDVARVHSPTTVELHRVCYDASLPGILVLYFRDERDYLFFSLRWV